MANTVLNVNVSIDLLSEAEKLQSLLTFLNTNGIQFSLGGSAPTEQVAAPKQSSSSTKKSGKSKSAKEPKAPQDEVLQLTQTAKVVTFKVTTADYPNGHFSKPAYRFMLKQAQTIDSKAVYDKSVKGFGFSTKSAATKFVKAFNGYTVTVEEQAKALAG